MNALSPLAQIVNSVRRLETLFPGFGGFGTFTNPKHNHYADFGYPENVRFSELYRMWQRNGIAKAAVTKTSHKTWQSNPFLLEQERDGSEQIQAKETPLEQAIRKRFSDLRLWQRLAEADRRAMVGGYSGVILRFADNLPFSAPVSQVPGGLMGLVELIPAWSAQLYVSQWDDDERSETYGQPTMYAFNEAMIPTSTVNPLSIRQRRAVEIHPDRVILWSSDGTVYAPSLLEAGYNDLLTIEKVSGAGGEGFWKNAKSAPVFSTDQTIDMQQMAKGMGVAVDKLADAMNEQVEDWQRGFDKLLMLQGMKADFPAVNLPDPENFYNIALQSFTASINMPTKILVGMQTGERASTEDATEWAQTIMSRREDETIPSIMSLVDRLEQVGVLPEKDWYLDWEDLTEVSMADKVSRASAMADTNQKMASTNELVFTPDEIRRVVDLEPLSDDEKYLTDPTGQEATDAMVSPDPGGTPSLDVTPPIGTAPGGKQ